MNFSVVLIARNEEKTLPRLMGSLSAFQEKGGEVVLVDTGSTDKTIEVAKSLGCKVTEVGERFIREITASEAESINRRFVVDDELPVLKAGDRMFCYSDARNFAASLSSNDMIAMPDCDEAFTKLDLDKVQQAIADGVEQCEYNFVFAHDAEGKPVVSFLHSKFYDRRKLHWIGIIHEVLSGEARRQFFDESVIKLEHWQNHETNRSGYLKGLALDCFENSDNDRNSHYLGRELLWTGRPKSAIKELMRHIQMNRWLPERSQSAIYVGQAFKDLGDEETAVKWWNKAYAIEAGRREPLIKLADHYYRKGDARRTAAYCEAALTIPQDNFYANDLNHYRQVPHEMLYWAYYVLGDKEKSRQHFDKALEYQPTNSKYLHDYRVDHHLPTVDIIIPQLGRPEGLKRVLASIEALNYPKEKITVTVDDRVEPTVPEKVRDMVAKTGAEFICFMANDAEMHPDSLVQAVIQWAKTGKRLVAMDSGRPDECEHFIVKRDLLPSLEDGLIFSTDMVHVGVDNWLWAQCEKLGEATRAELAKVTHHHFTRDAEFDAIYERGWKNAEKDREILKHKLATLGV